MCIAQAYNVISPLLLWIYSLSCSVTVSKKCRITKEDMSFFCDGGCHPLSCVCMCICVFCLHVDLSTIQCQLRSWCVTVGNLAISCWQAFSWPAGDWCDSLGQGHICPFWVHGFACTSNLKIWQHWSWGIQCHITHSSLYTLQLTDGTTSQNDYCRSKNIHWSQMTSYNHCFVLSLLPTFIAIICVGCANYWLLT